MSCKILALAGAAGALFGFILASPAMAQPNPHVTDGKFSSPQEWDTSRPTVTTHFFSPAADGSGNAWLYVEHFRPPQNAASGSASDRLYLMYDYVGSPIGSTPANGSFFDVFFQVNGGKDPNDYLVHFDKNGFNALERPNGNVPHFNSDGSFDLSDPGWNALTAQDLQLADFHAAEFFGPSPNLGADHLMGEFDLTVGEPSNGGDGIYSPEPAFWSASKGGSGDRRGRWP